jgi:hypothetical protein
MNEVRSKMRRTRQLALAALTVFALLFAVSPASAQISVPGFPAIGVDAGPGIIITINPNGSTGIANTGNGPYDGIEDTYIGVINNSNSPVFSLGLSAPSNIGIFGFEGDGIDTFISNFMVAPGNPDTTGYGGPQGFFTNILSSGGVDTGTINFVGGIPGGGGTGFFSLEEAISATQLTPQATTAVPEPASLALLGLATGVLVLARRRVRKVLS